MSDAQALIRTVTGDLDQDSTLHAQCHEHILLRRNRMTSHVPSLEIDDYEKSLAELIDYRLVGGDLIVDAQPGLCGRQENELARISAESGVHIVGVTGFHLPGYYGDLSFFGLPSDVLAKRFIGEITAGMLNEDGDVLPVRAGVVKAAVGDEKSFSLTKSAWDAVIKTTLTTGAPVLIHMDKSADPIKIVELFEKSGVSGDRILLCHMDRTNPHVDVHKAVCEHGVFLCYDSVHRLKYVSDKEEIELIKLMCEAGYSDRLLLSLDTTSERLRHYGGSIGLDYILTTFKTMLANADISEENIEQMTKMNAANWLPFKM